MANMMTNNINENAITAAMDNGELTFFSFVSVKMDKSIGTRNKNIISIPEA